MLDSIHRAVQRLFKDPEQAGGGVVLSSEERTRIRHFSIFLLLGVPTLVLLGFYNLSAKEYLLALLIFISAVALVGGWIMVRRYKFIKTIYRMNAFLFSLAVLYGLLIHDQSGQKIFWMYTIPMSCFFLLGKREGLIWNTLAFSGALVLITNPLNLWVNYDFPPSLIFRFMITYVIVSSMTYWFEYFRSKYSTELENKNRLLEQEIEEKEKTRQEREKLIQELQEALHEVKTLSGLLPICAHCKKIRDDKGYWNKIEGYIQEHSQAKFSHSICPECAKKLYPGVKLYEKE